MAEIEPSSGGSLPISLDGAHTLDNQIRLLHLGDLLSVGYTHVGEVKYTSMDDVDAALRRQTANPISGPLA